MKTYRVYGYHPDTEGYYEYRIRAAGQDEAECEFQRRRGFFPYFAEDASGHEITIRLHD